MAAILTLASCDAPSPDQKSTVSPDPTLIIIEEARSAVIARMKDPQSANFGELTIAPTQIVCGSVNARNSFGGYVGFSAFWYDPKTKEAFLHDPTQDWGGKAYDALLFKQKGCTIGTEQGKALEAAKALNESNKRLGMEPFGPKGALK